MISPCRAEALSAPTRTRGGFTLIELLVSMTVAAVLLGLLVFVIVRSLQLSQTSADTLSAYSSAATAMDLVATDLASLAVTRQPSEYLQALPESAQSNASLGSIPSPNVQPMRLLMLVTSPADSAQPASSPSPAPSPTATPVYADSGQVRAVSYLLAWQNPVSTTAVSDAGKVFGLYRQVASTADTFKYVLGSTDLYNTMYVGNNLGGLQVPPALSGFVTDNIVDFQIAFYANQISTGVGSGQGAAGSLLQPPVLINTVSASASASTALPYLKTQLQGTQTLVNGVAPTVNGSGYGPAVYAEVSLTVIEQPGAKLWGDGTGTGARSPAAIKQKYGHTLTRKVILRTPE